jgi:glutamate synthase (NADPH/NADH) small chain
MADPRGFIKHDREATPYREIGARLKDWKQVQEDFPHSKTVEQASRCMDCGIPFCNDSCPLGNIIPDFNDLVFRDQWQAALSRLHSTNNFPEFTGMLCPAPCEKACTLGINQNPVNIKQVEWELVRRGWEEGWIVPRPASRQSGKSVAIVGSGPAGLSAAQQLARAGHAVTVFEKADRCGGLLRYGIPDFKLEKGVIDRRLAQMREEGVTFQNSVNVGVDLSATQLREDFDAALLCMGAEVPRDLKIEGRGLAGVHFAMDFLSQQNRRVAGEAIDFRDEILATGRDVVVIGGGDTGSDCVGTSHRQGAKSVTSFELLPQGVRGRHASEPWPLYPRMSFTVSSSHQEGGERRFAVLTRSFEGEGGRLKTIHGVEVEFDRDARGRPDLASMREVKGGEFVIPADLVLLAMGFVHPVSEGLIEALGVVLDHRGNVAADTQRFETSERGIFAAGDVRRGQSLVVWAQWEGREAARVVDQYLMGESRLQSRTAFL